MGCMRLTARSEARGARLRKATIKPGQTFGSAMPSYARLCPAQTLTILDCFHSFVNSDTPFDCASYKSQDAPEMTEARLFDRSHGRITSTNHDEPSWSMMNHDPSRPITTWPLAKYWQDLQSNALPSDCEMHGTVQNLECMRLCSRLETLCTIR